MKNLLTPLLAVRSKQGYSILTAVMVTLFSAWVVFDATKVRVVFAANDEVQTVKAHMTTVADLLEEVGIEVEEHDYLSHSIDAKLTDGMEVQYKQAEAVWLTVDGAERELFHTTEATVGEFFSSIKLELSEHDVSSHDGNRAITPDMEIVVDHAFEIDVVDGGKKQSYWTTKQSVQQFLEEKEIAIDRLDEVKPKLDQTIQEDTKIEITRVEIDEETIEEEVAFETEEKPDANLEKGKKKVVQEGKPGKALVSYQVRKENGKEVSREKVSEETIEKAVKEIVKIGTKEVVSGKQATAAPAGKGKVMVMEATGYGADCKGCSGITATGINIKANPGIKVISVDPNVIPLGSRVWVEGYGEAIAGDTGGAIKGNRIDVLLPSEAYAAQHWGRRTVKVKILD